MDFKNPIFKLVFDVLRHSSISIPPTRRVNMSFTNERLREIERHNHILLNKILSARNSRKSSIPPREQPARNPVPAAAVHRKLQQKKIDHDNMVRNNLLTRRCITKCMVLYIACISLGHGWASAQGA